MTNEDKMLALRREMSDQIVSLMKEQGLEEIEFDVDEFYDPTYVLVHCDSDNDWHESVVSKVSLVGNEEVEFHCDDERVSAVLGWAEMICNPVERYEGVRQNILRTLGIPDSELFDTAELTRFKNQVETTRDAILREMFNCVDATPQKELCPKTSYRTVDEEYEMCCVTGFEIKDEVLVAVLEYEISDTTRRVPVHSLRVEELLSIMVSMIKK